MFKLFNSFFNKPKADNDPLRKQLRMAKKLFERAMRNHGVNSEQANYWSAEIDAAENALKM